MRRFAPPLASLSLALAVAGCGDATLPTNAFRPTKGTVVLNGFGAQGVTMIPDTGTATSAIAFGASFDGGSLRVERDTVLTTSSKGGGDLLYVSALALGTVKTIQMPAGSNPGTAAMANGLPQGAIVVALRDSQAIAFVSNVGGASPTVSLVRGIGTCPSDLFVYDGDVWVLDANQACRTTYAVQGPSRLLRVSLSGLSITTIDTIALGATVKGATNMARAGEYAYIGGGGDINYGTVPPTIVQGGSLARVALTSNTTELVGATPPGTFGTRVSVAADGSLYAFVYADPSTFQGRALRVNPGSLAFVGPFAGATSFLDLKAPDSTAANCVDVIGDIRGRIYCPVVGAGAASRVYVYNAGLGFIRNLPAGQGAVAITSR
ncbi:MAG: hypothetical protein HYX65_07240 [Gemmatimonadetes bacterium]|nr:hypothetical protein [Gemmatimonadota bacterium]